MLDLFGNTIKYLTECIVCQKKVAVEIEPPTKQLSFFVCGDCRKKGESSNGCGESNSRRNNAAQK